jgi:aspartyl-tRNA(Asn)/glutamyl-tRNA(Gln) amidotransferase subunit A
MSVAGEDVLFASTAEQSARIRRREISPVELTEAYLERIARWNPRLNAYARVTADLARTQARQAESEIARGRWRGPLHGIPCGVKDLFATAGIETEWGAEPCRGQRFDRDATVVRRLREAGAVLLGKLAMVEFAGGLGYRFAGASSSGPGRNPWNPSRWAGGSSSGAGAATSAGLASFAIGTETWGSILCPAAFCGVTGLRPTYGRVSRAGGMVCSYSFDKVGPLARSAADCRLVLEAIAGHDPEDPTSSREPVRLARGTGRPIRSLRGALVPLDFSKGREPDARGAFDRAVAELRAMGLRLEEAKLPEFPAGEVAGLIITAEALSAFERFHQDGSVARLHDPYARYQWEIHEAMTGADLVKAWRMRRVLQEKMSRFFAEWDVIVTPNFLTGAPPVEEDLNVTLAGYSDPVGAVGNACGLPAIALPSGFNRDRLPLGFQIVGAPFSEATLLDLGEAFQARPAFRSERPALRG